MDKPIAIQAEFLSFDIKDFTIGGNAIQSRQLTVKIGGDTKTLKSTNISKDIDFNDYEPGDKLVLIAEPIVVQAQVQFGTGPYKNTMIESYRVVGIVKDN